MKDWQLAILVVLFCLLIFELRFGSGQPTYEIVVQEQPEYTQVQTPFIVAPNYRVHPFSSLGEALSYIHDPNAPEATKLRRAVALSVANSGGWQSMQQMANFGFSLELNIDDLAQQGVHTVDQYESMSVWIMSEFLANSMNDLNQPTFPQDLMLTKEDLHILFYTNAPHPYREAYQNVFCIAFPSTAAGCEAHFLEVDMASFM